VGRPPGYPFNLNSAVDTLLKKEFDIHRANKSRHPLMETYGIDAVPFEHSELDTWRENFKGVRFHHEPTNFVVTGAVDDVWINKAEELIVVDYKATSKNGEVSLDAPWQISYKRQMEVYQWLLRKNGFKVSDTGYFVYCNGKTDLKAFDAKLEFDVVILPYTGKDDWIDETLAQMKESLNQESLPEKGKDCDYCEYRSSAEDFEV
jgi:ATP-dependent exoDNAse (exonuclease V) beta subunit